VAWAADWPERTWAVEGAGGLGHLLAQQLVAAGSGCSMCHRSWVPGCDCLATGNINRNDPNDARSVAVAALRLATRREVTADFIAAGRDAYSCSPCACHCAYAGVMIFESAGAQPLFGVGIWRILRTLLSAPVGS
jgi:hypothetical protein